MSFAMLRLASGDFPRARGLLLQAPALSVALERPYAMLRGTSVAVPLALATCDTELLDRFARDDFVELVFDMRDLEFTLTIASAFAELYESRGEHDRGASLLRRALGTARTIGEAPWFAIAVARYGAPDDPGAARDLLARWSEPAGNRAGSAYLALFDALAAPRTGHADVERANEAVAGLASLGLSYFEAPALEAAKRLEEAFALYRRMGSERDVRRLEARLSPPNRRGRPKGALTAREREIGELISQGLSNRAIAAKLVLSERTVESHVASILTKIDGTSRAQIATYVALGQHS